MKGLQEGLPVTPLCIPFDLMRLVGPGRCLIVFTGFIQCIYSVPPRS